MAAYYKIDWVRNAVNNVWGALKTAFNWVPSNWPKLLAILTGPFGLAVYMIATHFDAIKGGIVAGLNWIIDRLNDTIDLFNGAIGAYNKIPAAPNIGKIGHIGHIEGMATGGVVGRACSTLVNAVRSGCSCLLVRQSSLLGSAVTSLST